jgi:hypothetical protein
MTPMIAVLLRVTTRRGTTTYPTPLGYTPMGRGIGVWGMHSDLEINN